ncbi:hypothetical protein KKE45_01195 [Patescibacteria group bacterium]|nr:hypothetical protein [Patescibacteria group bacterium]
MERTTRKFIIKWTKLADQNFSKDNRGWPKGKRRTWAKITAKKVETIFQSLENDPTAFFTGATAIDLEWRNRYQTTPPPIRTIGKILADFGLSKKRKKGRNKEASRYLCYPEYTIYNLLEADFIGKKYITGRTKPLNFISFSFKKEPKLRHFQRIDGQTANNFINQTDEFFKKFEKPDFIKVDNCLATIGSASGKRNLSQVMKFLLKNQIIPIFAVPRKPFSQASIEGNNSVFSRKFWNRIQFKNLAEVDKKLEWFNQSSQQYLRYQYPKKIQTAKKEKFIPKIYFTRQVKEDATRKRMNGYINILNEQIHLPKAYINYFVLAEWNLKQERLYIRFEKDEKSKVVKKLSFKINQRSKRGGSLSFRHQPLITKYSHEFICIIRIARSYH